MWLIHSETKKTHFLTFDKKQKNMDATEAIVMTLEKRIGNAASNGQTSITEHMINKSVEQIEEIATVFRKKGYSAQPTKDTFDVYEQSIYISWG